MTGPLVRQENGEKSVNERKSDALKGIEDFEGIPPKWGMAHLAGVSHDTLELWQREDHQFKRDLQNIINDKRIQYLGQAHFGLTQSLRRGDSPTVRATLMNLDPQTWSGEPQEKPVEREYLIGLYGEPREIVDVKAVEVKGGDNTEDVNND